MQPFIDINDYVKAHLKLEFDWWIKKVDFTLDWNRNNKMLIKLKNKIEPEVAKNWKFKIRDEFGMIFQNNLPTIREGISVIEDGNEDIIRSTEREGNNIRDF